MLNAGEVVTGLQATKSQFKKSERISALPQTYHALVYRQSGVLRIYTEGRQLVSRKGSIVFIPAGTVYQTDAPEEGWRIAIHFTTTGGKSHKTAVEVFEPEHVTAMRNQFLSLMERYKVGREQDYGCMAMLYEILASIEYEQTRSIRSAIPQRMLDAREHIDRCFGDKDLTIAQLAAEAGVSEVYFRREFRRYFDTSPIAYLKKTRIENARLLLSTDYYSISDVAAQCGFESLSYFSYEFHRLTGKTPTEASGR